MKVKGLEQDFFILLLLYKEDLVKVGKGKTYYHTNYFFRPCLKQGDDYIDIFNHVIYSLDATNSFVIKDSYSYHEILCIPYLHHHIEKSFKQYYFDQKRESLIKLLPTNADLKKYLEEAKREYCSSKERTFKEKIIKLL